MLAIGASYADVSNSLDNESRSVVALLWLRGVAGTCSIDPHSPPVGVNHSTLEHLFAISSVSEFA